MSINFKVKKAPGRRYVNGAFVKRPIVTEP